MDTPLDAVAVRVLGSMIEKEITTPDNYPLSLYGLVAACNQTSARDPVMQLDETTVSRSLNNLRQHSLARGEQRSDSRVMRYRHLLSDKLSLDAAELAVMCVLMLRGAQTAGEIKGRTNRLFDFPDLAAVEATLDALIGRQPTPLVARLPRRPGQKDARYAHLLSGEIATDTPEPATRAPAESSRLDALEQSVNTLRAEVVDLRTQLEEFRRQFQ